MYAQGAPPPARENIQAPQPVRPSAMREPSPAPKLVWLHRPLNHNRDPSDPPRPLPILEQQRA